MANVFDMKLDLTNAYEVSGNPSWGGGFGSNAYYAVVGNDGRTYVYEATTGEVVHII